MSISEDKFKSVGLIFEPNFFTAHFYSDPEGKNHVLSRNYKEHEPPLLEVEAEVSPLFGIYANLNWTLVPRSVFRPEDSARYLKLNTGFDGEGEADSVEIPRIESTLVYEAERRAEDIARNLHPSLITRPLILPLLNYASILAESDFPDLVHLHVRDKIAYIIIMRNKKLLLANSFEVKKTTDLDYFVFYVMKKLGTSAKTPFFYSSYGSEYTKLSAPISERLANQKDLPIYRDKDKSMEEVDLLALISPECA